MRIEDLAIFTDVIRYHSMNLAAEKNFMTPQNLSKIIRNMERELDVVLFKRSKNGSELTKEGEKFYLQIAKVLNEYEKALELLHKEPGQVKHKANMQIKVLCNQGATNYAVLSAYKSFQKEEKYDAFLEVDMMKNHDFQQMAQEIVQKNADIAVCLMHDSEVNSFMQSCPNYIPMYILQSEYMLMVSTNNPLAKRTMVSIAEICQQKFIATKETLGYKEVFGKEVPCVMRLDSMNATIDQVIYSDDYCTMVCKCLSKILKQKEEALSFIPFEKKIYGTFMIMLRSERSDDAAIQDFVKMIGQIFFESPDF